MKEGIIRYFPSKIQKSLSSIDDVLWNKIEEIRLGVGKPILVCTNENIYYLKEDNTISDKFCERNMILSEKEINCILELITDGSIYAVSEKIKNGYITLPGGHRVGIAGTGVIADNKIQHIKDISSLNFRICREIIDVSTEIIPFIYNNNILKNTLIIGPPKSGKTTYLRDIARLLGNEKNRLKVSIVDERGEIASMHNRITNHSMGIFCDVLDFCPKSKGMMLMVRAMSPDVIITDEIGVDEDIDAIKNIARCGVKIITTIHGYDDTDIPSEIKNLFELKIILSNRHKTGTIEKIIECR